MIEPYLSDDAFLADVESVRGAAHVHLWWMGQSGFLLSDGGTFSAIDPYLSDSLTRKYASTSKPHVRMSRRVIDPARLGFVSTITSSHNHTDHLDAETINAIRKANADVQIIVPEANRGFASERLGIPCEQLLAANAWRPLICNNWVYTGVPAAHDTLEMDAQGRHKYLGYMIRVGPFTIYHSGDTMVYPGLAERLAEHEVTVAILPINGQVGNMSGTDAARLAKDAGVRCVIPCHYDMFEFNTATPNEFVSECERIGQPYRVLRQGERWSSSDP